MYLWGYKCGAANLRWIYKSGRLISQGQEVQASDQQSQKVFPVWLGWLTQKLSSMANSSAAKHFAFIMSELAFAAEVSNGPDIRRPWAGPIS